MPGLIAKKHQLQLAKRANQRALFAAVTWAAPRAPMRSLYAKDRRRSGPSKFRNALFADALLSPIASRHA